MKTVADVLRSTHISYSRLEKFRKCPYAFRVEYLDGVGPAVSSREAQLGSLVHEIIARYLADIRGTTRLHETVPADVARWVAVAERALREQGKLTACFDLAEVVPFLESFAATVPRIDGRAVAEIEAEKRTRIGPWILKSVLDLVLVRSSGRKHILDFKTGNPKYVNSRQLKTYALPVLGSPNYGHETIELSYVFLKNRTVRRFCMARHECDTIAREVARQVRVIEGSTDFPARPSPLCAWCGVREFCDRYRSRARTR